MAVVIPLNNPGGPEGDTVTVDEKLLNTEYCRVQIPILLQPGGRGAREPSFGALVLCISCNGVIHRGHKPIQGDDNGHVGRPCEVSLAPPCPELCCELSRDAGIELVR